MAENLSNLVRLAPLQLSDLPSHPDLPQSSSSSATSRPQLSSFLQTLLNDGSSFISPSSIQTTFKPHSTKSSPPSTSKVEIQSRSISALQLTSLSWSPRPKPSNLAAEHWFLRRSLHPNTSSKHSPGGGGRTASWPEFIYGIRDNHSKHEFDFTPTLYDAHKVLDWNASVRAPDFLRQLNSNDGAMSRYSDITLSIYEMCHSIPPPLAPRSFPVVVATASTGPREFIAVTVPVDLGRGLEGALYSSGRNKQLEGEDGKRRKEVVLGVYAAVERCTLLPEEQGEGMVEWVMATASDAKGSLPMWAQKLGIPGAIAKDVGYFLKWIPTVPEEDIKTQGPQTSPARGT